MLGERPDTGVLELGWVDGRKQIDRDTEIAVELLCEHVLHALSRIEEAAAPNDVRAIEATVPRGWTRGGALARRPRKTTRQPLAKMVCQCSRGSATSARTGKELRIVR